MAIEKAVRCDTCWKVVWICNSNGWLNPNNDKFWFCSQKCMDEATPEKKAISSLYSKPRLRKLIEILPESLTEEEEKVWLEFLQKGTT